MTDDWNDINRHLTRRDTLTAGSATLTTLLAGCTTSDNSEPPTDTPTATETTEHTPTEQTTTQEDTRKSFEEIYDETYDNEEMALYDDQWTSIEDQGWESRSHMLERVNSLVSRNFTINNDSQEQARLLKRAIHNDLRLSNDEVRVLGRDMAGGGTYTAILHKNQDGDWVKDLALPDDGEEGSLRHNETENDINFNHETERGLWNIWDRSDPTTVSATDFITLRNSYEDIDRDDVDESVYEDAKRHVDRGNDHVVVGEPYDETTVDYTVPAAERLTEIQNWHGNDTLNEEMAVVEQATEAYHNSEEPYISMEMQDGEVTAVPTEEHQGPGTLYEIFDE